MDEEPRRLYSSRTVDRPELNIVYVDAQPLILAFDSEHVVSTAIAVRNNGSTPGRADFCTLLQNPASQDCVSNVTIVGANNPLDRA